MPETHIGKVFLDQKDIVKLHIIHRQVQGMNMFHFIGLGERIMVIIRTLTPVPTQPIFPTETPTPTIPDNTITDVDSVVNKWGSYNWPSEPASGAGITIKIDLDYGQLISYHDSNNNVKYYVVANENGYKGRELGSSQDQGHYYWTPDGANGDLIAITKNPPHTWKNAINGVIYNLSKGDIYIDPQGYTYIYKATSTNQSVPNGVGNSQWVKVLDNEKLKMEVKKYPVQVHCNIKLQWT